MYYSGADQECLPEWAQRAELQEEVLIGDGGKRIIQEYVEEIIIIYSV